MLYCVMVTSVASIQCLLDKGIIDQEQADEMTQIVSVLPSDPSSLLQILVALNLTQEP